MTHDEIENMPAGHEMDVLIAKHVMGLTVTSNEEAAYRKTANGYSDKHFVEERKYSTDLSFAGAIVRRFVPVNNKPFVLRYNDKEYTDWNNNKIAVGWYCSFEPLHIVPAYAETAPLAICRAALMAVMK